MFLATLCLSSSMWQKIMMRKSITYKTVLLCTCSNCKRNFSVWQKSERKLCVPWLVITLSAISLTLSIPDFINYFSLWYQIQNILFNTFFYVIRHQTSHKYKCVSCTSVCLCFEIYNKFFLFTHVYFNSDVGSLQKVQKLQKKVSRKISINLFFIIKGKLSLKI